MNEFTLPPWYSLLCSILGSLLPPAFCSQPLDPLAPLVDLLHAVFYCPHLHHHSLHLRTTLAQELHNLGLSLHTLDEQSVLSRLALASPPDLMVKDSTAWLLQTTEPPEHKPLEVKIVVVGPFEEEEEGTVVQPATNLHDYPIMV